MKLHSVTAYTLIGMIAFNTLSLSNSKNHAKGNTQKNSTRCGRGRFYDETLQDCRTCSNCGPGSSVTTRCKRNRDTKCEKCPSGSFSTSFTYMPARCRRCTNCGKRPTAKECTSTSNTVCGPCPLGTYWDSFDITCVQCSYCFRDTYKDSLKAPACQISEIPTSHQCYQMLWPPYKPPSLLKRENKKGIYFVSSLSTSPESTTIDFGQTTTALEAKRTGFGLQTAFIVIVILCTFAVTITAARRCSTSSVKPQYEHHIYKKFQDGKSRWKSQVNDEAESPLTAV